MVIRFRSRTHGRIRGIAISLLFPLLVIGNISAQEKSDQKIKSEAANDSWWAERAALFFPRYHFTLQATNPRIASGDNGKISAPNAIQAGSQTWGANAGTAWYTTSNWALNNGTFPGLQGAAASNNDIATWSSAATATTFGITMTTASLNLGAISLDSTRTINTSIGNSGATAGVLRLYGATVNGVADVILRNNSTGLLTLQASQTGTMGVVLSDTTNNIINIDNTGGVTISSIITESAAGNKLTLGGAGSGALTLSGANTYTGGTTVGTGILQIGANTVSGTTITSSAVGTGTLTLGNGATLRSDSATARTLKNNLSLSGNIVLGATATQTGTLTFDSVGLTTPSTVVLTGDTQLTINVAITINNVISGSGINLTKAGTATLTLGAANTYDGLTTITAGTLAESVSNALATGGLTVNGATAIFDLGASHNDTVGTVTLAGGGSINGTGTSTLTSTGTFELQSGTVNAILAGSGIALNKTTAGTVTLNGVNTYTGLTNITAGTLAEGVNNAISTGDLTVNGATAIFDLGASHTDTVGIVTLDGGGAINGTGTSALTSTGTFELRSGTVGAILAGSGIQLNKTTSGTVTLNGVNTYTGLTNITAGTLTEGVNNAIASGALTVDGATAIFNLGASHTDTVGIVTLDGGGTINGTGTSTLTSTGTFELKNGTVNAILAGSGIALNKTTAGTVTLNGLNTYTGLTNITAGTLAEGVSNAISTGSLTVNGATAIFDLGASHTDTVGIVTLDGGGAINGSGTSTLTSTGTFELKDGTVNAILAGSGIALNKTTAGTVTLNGLNTYTGLTNITAGTLTEGVSNAISTGALTVNGATAIFDLGASHNDSVGTVTLGGGGAINGSGTSTLTTTGTFEMQSGTVNAILAGGVALNKTTAGTATLNAANTYTGLTTITAGTLAEGVDNAIATGALTVNGATAIFDLGASHNDSVGTVTLAGGGAINGTGTSTLTTTGTFEMQSGTANAILAGSVALNKTTAGTATLTGANTYTGLTTVSTGVLNIQDDTALGTIASGTSVTSGAALQLQGGIAVGAETLTLNGTGISSDGGLRSISGNNSWAGAITINSTTRINSDSGTLTLDVASGNAITGSNDDLQFGGAGNVTINDAISTGTGALTKDGAGTLTLNSANSYSGVTTVSAGTLRATTSANALGTGTLTLSGGTLELANDTGLAFNRNTTVSADSTIISDVLTPGGAGATHTLGTLAISGQTLTIGVGANVGSGTAGITFGAVTNTNPGDTTFDVASGARLTLGAITSSGNQDKTLTFTGSGDTDVTGIISDSGAHFVELTKSGSGALTLSAVNAYTGNTTVNGGTLNLDYTAVSSRLDDSSVLVLGGGTVNLQNGASAHNEVVASTTINAGASGVARSSGTSVLRLNAITRNAGGTVNFGAANIADTDTTNTNGILGPWATINGTAFATNSTNGANGLITALAAYGQTVTRLSSGTKIIANTAANNVQITDGTGTAANITLAAATTTINTLTNSAPGTTSPAGDVTIDPAGQTLRVGGILNASGSSALTIGNGTNNGTLAANTSGGELILHNYSSNDLTINSVIGNNSSASRLTTSGTGRIILTATNGYTGATTVNAGTLFVNGSLNSASAVTVNGSGTVLGGTGTISGAVTVNANAILQGGTGTTGATQKLTLSGNLTLADNSIIQLALGPSGAHSTLARTGGTWSFDSNQAFSFIDLGATAGTYDNIITGLASNPGVGSWTITNDQWSGTFSFDGANIDLNLTAVPEPATWISGILALGLLTWTQRQRFARLVRRQA